MSKKWFLFLFILTVAVRLVFHLITNYTVDDALITFRYAENLAAGNGFVYSSGERVLGTSTPLYTLLLAVLNILHVGSLAGSLLINLAAAGMTSCVLFRWADDFEARHLALLPVLAYAFFPRSVISDICGLETGLFTFLATVSLYFLYRKKYLQAVMIASIAGITRPEGFALLIIAVAISIWNQRRLRLLIPPLVGIGGWLLFSQLYFGGVIPNSAIAKHALYSGARVTGFWDNLILVFVLRSPMSWLIWLFFSIGMIVTWEKSRILLLSAFLALGYLFTLALSGTHIFFWYSAPIYPVIFLISNVGLSYLLSRVGGESDERMRRVLSGLTVVLTVAALTVAIVIRLPGIESESLNYHNVHAAAGKYLLRTVAPGETVLAEDIGYLGYFYRGSIIDRDGLVTPQAIPYNKLGNYRAFIDSVNADWLFLATDSPGVKEMIDSESFKEKYVQVSFQTAAAQTSHLLFRKHQPAETKYQ